MGVKKETPLQERIQTLVRRMGGKADKNHGNMIGKPGLPDLTCCYQGYYLTIEVKVDDNVPTKQQGIEARKVWKAKGICIVAWDVETVKRLLEHIDYLTCLAYRHEHALQEIRKFILKNKIDDGTRW